MVGEKIPEGYKLTEVGVVPEEWEVVEFKNLYIEPSRNGVYKTSEYQGSGTRIVNMGEMFRYELITNQEMSRVKLNNKELLINTLKDGDLLFGRRSVVPAGAGKCSMIISPKEELTFESSIIRVRLDQEVIFPKFYFYFFASKYGSSVISPIVSGTTIKGIRASELKNIPVPLPPLPEQKAIAEVLSDTDALIESLEALIAKKRAVKQGSMQELLTGRRRLPGFAVSGRYRQTEVGVVPEEWEVVSIGTCATVIGGGTPSTRNSQYWDGQINWFTPSEVGKAKYLRESIRKISILGLKNSSAKSLPSGTILLTTRATIGETGILLNKASTNQGFQSLIPVKDKTDTEFFYYLLNTIKPKLLSLSSGSTFLELNPTKLRSITISLPPLPEQKAIAEVLSDMDAEIEALEQKRDKYKKIKQGMMDQLLTGKVRLYER